MDNKIHVAYLRLNLADDYNRHTGASIASVLANCSRPVVVHIFSPETSYISKNCNVSSSHNCVTSEIEKYHRLVDKYNAEIKFHTFQSLDWLNPYFDKNLFKTFTNHGLFRLFLSELLPNVDWVFSLGSDTIVLTDLAKLQDQLPIDTPLAGANDYETIMFNNNSTIMRQYAKKHNISLENYVCPDVLAFNLKYIRDNDLLPEKAIDYMKKNQNIRLFEMDVLNAIFRDNILILPSRYHINPCFKLHHPREYSHIYNGESDIESNCIIHFGGSTKPWNKYATHYDYEYWSYLSLTPWGEDINIFREMSKTIQIPENIATYIDEFVWVKPIGYKLILCFLIPARMYLGLIKQYINRYIKKND